MRADATSSGAPTLARATGKPDGYKNALLELFLAAQARMRGATAAPHPCAHAHGTSAGPAYMPKCAKHDAYMTPAGVATSKKAGRLQQPGGPAA